MIYLRLLILLLGTSLSVSAAISQLNVLSFGAKPNSTPTSSNNDTTAFVNAAAASAATGQELYVPGGRYTIDHLVMDGIPSMKGDGGPYTEGTIIYQRVGATTDLLQYRNATFRPIVSGFTFIGRKETNLRNTRTITAVANRYQFTVSGAPPTGYIGPVFFFLRESGVNHYLGSGVMDGAPAGNVVTLATSQDWFATPTSSAPLLNTSCIAAFGEQVTENAVTVSDPTRAGVNCVDLQGLGAYATFENCRWQGFHCAWRVGVALAPYIKGVNLSSENNFADYYTPFTASGSDAIIDYFQGGGGYAPEKGHTDTGTPLTDSINRRTKFGIVTTGTDTYMGHIVLYQHLREVFINASAPCTIESLHMDSSAYEALVVAGLTKLNVGNLVVRGCGNAATETYAAILNVDSSISVGNGFFNNANGIRSGCMVENLSAVCSNVFLNISETSGLARETNGYPVFERKFASLSQIDYMRWNDFTLSGRGLQGRHLVYGDFLNQWGIRMSGTGTGPDPFGVAVLTGGTNQLARFTQTGLGIGRLPLNYALEVAGDSLVTGRSIPTSTFQPLLQGSDIPVANVNGAYWIHTTNAVGNQCWAAIFPGGEKVYFFDKDGNITPHNVASDSIVSAPVIIGTTSISTPLFQPTAVETGSMLSTNGLRILQGTTAPTAASIGAGKGQAWVSNSVPPTIYWTATTDGITATTYKVAGP